MQGFDSFTYVHLVSRRLIYAYLLFVSRPWARAQNLQKRHSRKRHQHLLAPCASLNDSQLIFFLQLFHFVSRCITLYPFVSLCTKLYQFVYCINLYLRSRLELQTLVSSASTRAARSPASLKLAPLAWLPCAWNKSPSWNWTPISQTSQMEFKRMLVVRGVRGCYIHSLLRNGTMKHTLCTSDSAQNWQNTLNTLCL